MQCWSSSGVGKKFKWKVVLQDLESDYSDNEETKYTNAIIDNIQTPINQGIKPGEVTTVTITGSNFGPKLSEYGFDWPVTATYGQNVIDYNAANCTVTESHTTIQCYSVDAENDKNRINLKWQLTIATIQSPESSVTVNMSSPRLDSFVGTKHKYLATDGTDYITIKGEHLGATGSIVNNAKYESESSIFGDGNDNSPYTPTCEVLNNTFLQCKMVPGIGAFF
jgi:hypothetical protein